MAAGTIRLVHPSKAPVSQRCLAIQLDGLKHTGQDYYYSYGGEIFPDAYAMDAGTVIYSGDSRALGWPNAWYLNPDFDRNDDRDDSAGNIVVIGHWYGVTIYGHLESWDVVAGQDVAQGQRIGTVGSTGRSSGKHLHAELLLAPFNFNTDTYGRTDINLFINMEGTDMTPHELLIHPAYTGGPQVSEVLKMMVQVYQGMFFGGPSTPYKASLFNLVDDVARRSALATANFPVTRGDKTVRWVQDTANGTSGLEVLLTSALPNLAEQLKLDPETIRSAFLEAIGNPSVTIDFHDAGPATLATEPPAALMAPAAEVAAGE
ncbi:lysin A [Arthrobacter phage Idaho]|uniref:Lysin A n=1 Tax=Arthrobacter phage Idaho TaxID=2565509 RepID=A0A4D6T839_9CAUD|nr:lysin A [Arthrobacter phage Idaho]QCG78279.1 lysin A [Arthrobacter phage Idaho]